MSYCVRATTSNECFVPQTLTGQSVAAAERCWTELTKMLLLTIPQEPDWNGRRSNTDTLTREGARVNRVLSDVTRSWCVSSESGQHWRNDDVWAVVDIRRPRTRPRRTDSVHSHAEVITNAWLTTWLATCHSRIMIVAARVTGHAKLRPKTFVLLFCSQENVFWKFYGY